MQYFYVFLDIDGVLYDNQWLIAEYNKGNTEVRKHNVFKKESMEALNFLINSLAKNYMVDLVISSTWRANMLRTQFTLLNNGLSYYKPIHRTAFGKNPQNRGEEILEYLKNKKDNNNFVIIDDEYFDFKKHFSSSKIIKTNMENNSLSMEMVQNFIGNLLQTDNDYDALSF